MTQAPTQTHPSASPAATGRLRELDLLRFVAAAVVMLHHFVGRIGGWGVENHDKMPVVAPIAHFGNLGVDLFFLISGFVILMSAWGRNVQDFVTSRVVRIFPAYWFSVALAVVLFLVTGLSAVPETPDGNGPLRAFLPNMTMLQAGVGAQGIEVVYWTLWVELHFYALIALLVWRGITYSRCVAFMVGWLLLGTFAREAEFSMLTAVLFPVWAPYFVAGMAFFLIWRFGSNLALWLIIAFSWALAVYNRVSIVNKELVWPGTWDTVTTIVVSAIFLIMALVATHKLSWLGWRGFTVLGALTYPTYLLHETFGRILVDRLGWRLDISQPRGRWELLGICFAVVLVSSYLVYRLVERPAQRWLRPRLKDAVERIRQQSAAAAAKAGAATRPDVPLTSPAPDLLASGVSVPHATHGEPGVGGSPLDGRWERESMLPRDGMA